MTFSIHPSSAEFFAICGTPFPLGLRSQEGPITEQLVDGSRITESIFPNVVLNVRSQQTVFIVEADARTRDALTSQLRSAGFHVHAFSSAQAFRAFYQGHQPGCLLVDIGTPKDSGLDLCEQLRRDGIRLPIIFLAAYADFATVVAAMQLGAMDFLQKPVARDTLRDRLHKALALDGEWRQRDAALAELRKRVARLTPREQETLELIRAGETNKAIAARLLITERAVEMRRSSIMRKLKVRSVAELIDIATTYRVLEDLRTTSNGNLSDI